MKFFDSRLTVVYFFNILGNGVCGIVTIGCVVYSVNNWVKWDVKDGDIRMVFLNMSIFGEMVGDGLFLQSIFLGNGRQ